jgi:hypothetical protein
MNKIKVILIEVLDGLAVSTLDVFSNVYKSQQMGDQNLLFLAPPCL